MREIDPRNHVCVTMRRLLIVAVSMLAINSSLAEAAPDLVVDPVMVSDSTVTKDEVFNVTATVLNQGNADSSASELRFKFSTDPTITAGDPDVSFFVPDVDILSPGSSTVVVSQAQIPDVGTFWVGACVAPVLDESDTANNCSTGIQVSVGVKAMSCYLDTSCSGSSSTKVVRNASSGQCVALTECWELWKCADGPITGDCGGGSANCLFSEGCFSDAERCFDGSCSSVSSCNDRIRFPAGSAFAYADVPTLNQCECSNTNTSIFNQRCGSNIGSCVSVSETGTVISGSAVIGACSQLSVGPTVTLESTSDVTIESGGTTRLFPEFYVEQGAQLEFQICGQNLCEPTDSDPLEAQCHSCVDQICFADPFCCNNRWDEICVNQVRSVCGLSCD